MIVKNNICEIVSEILEDVKNEHHGIMYGFSLFPKNINIEELKNKLIENNCKVEIIYSNSLEEESNIIISYKW